MAVLALLTILLWLPAMTLTSEGTTRPVTKAAGRAALTIADVQPLTVTGRGFKAGERVRVTAGERRKTVTAGARGGFKVVFAQASACNGVVIVARGSEGSRASVAFANISNVHCLEP